MAAISSTKIYKRESLEKAQSIDNGTALIDYVVQHAIHVAQIVLKFANYVPGIEPSPVAPTFEITKDLLIKLSDVTALEAKVNAETTAKVQKFFEEHFDSKNAPKDLFTIKDEPTSSYEPIRNHLQIQYRQHKDWFKKINLHPKFQKLSCFYYVFERLGILEEANQFCKLKSRLHYDKLAMILSPEEMKAKALTPTGIVVNSDCVAFLQSKNYQQAALPLQENDVLVYIIENKPIHAALVAQNTSKVFAKFGNELPFAYQHDLDETPTMYGDHYIIFRKPTSLS